MPNNELSVGKRERLDVAPDTCPTCGFWMYVARKAPPEHTKGRTGWTPYRMISEAPAAGCGNCGHLILLKTALAMNTGVSASA